MNNEQMVRAFNEWMRRFIADPDSFEREFRSVNTFLYEQNNGREPTYGEACTAYISKLNQELTS